MKLFKKKSGFSMVELVIAVGLLGAVSIGTGFYISNSFKDSNKLANKADVQNSVTALMNKIETEVKMADIPVLVDGFANNNFTITKPGSAGTTFVLTGNVVTAGGNRYENIKSIDIDLVAEKRGIEIEIIGQDDMYKLSGSYYTRNTQSSSTPIGGNGGGTGGGSTEYECACAECDIIVSSSGEYCSSCTSTLCEACGDGTCTNCCDEHSVPGPGQTYDCACTGCSNSVSNSGEYCSNCTSSTCSTCGECINCCDRHSPGLYECACEVCTNKISSGTYCSRCTSTLCEVCGNGTCINCCDGHSYECACEVCTNKISSGTYCSNCVSTACSGGCGNCDKHCTCAVPVRLTYVENADGVTNMPTPQSEEYKKGDSIPISSTIPKKDYYTFKEWQDAEGNSYEAGKVITINKDLTLKAQWEQNYKEVKLIYDPITSEPYEGYLNDSLNKSAETYKIYEPNTSVSVKLTESIPTSEAYYFVGWSLYSTQENYEHMAPDSITLTEDKTIYALWDNRVEVTYDANGGNWDGVSETMNVTEIYGEKYSFPTIYEKRYGYNFDGWYTEKNGGVKLTDDSVVNNIKAHTLYAHWTPVSITVSYYVNDGTVTPVSKAVTYGAPYGNLPTPTRTGYTFDGWYTARNGGHKITSSTTVTAFSNHRIYAHWKANTYTISFKSDGGGAMLTPMTVTYGEEYGEIAASPGVPVSGYNYKFLGWFTAETGGTQIISTSKVTIASNHTLYARFEKQVCTVTFDANGESWNPGSKEVAYGNTYGWLPVPGNTGYSVFLGWYTSATGGTQVTSSTKVTSESNHTLYAHWKIISIGEYVDYRPTVSEYVVTEETSGYSIWLNGKSEDQYFYPSQYKGDWRILGVNNSGELMIISDAVGYLWLYGISGYNNFDDIMIGIGNAYINSYASRVLVPASNEIDYILEDVWLGERFRIGNVPATGYVSCNNDGQKEECALWQHKWVQRQCGNTIYSRWEIDDVDTNYGNNVQIVICLDPDVILTGGTGTASDPYTISY